MAANSSLRSSKCSQKHSTYIEAAIPIVAVLEKISSVRTYVLGVIKQGGKSKRMKVKVLSGAVLLVISGSGATQEVWVYPHTDSLIHLAIELQSQQSKWQEYTCIFPKGIA